MRYGNTFDILVLGFWGFWFDLKLFKVTFCYSSKSFNFLWFFQSSQTITSTYFNFFDFPKFGKVRDVTSTWARRTPGVDPICRRSIYTSCATKTMRLDRWNSSIFQSLNKNQQKNHREKPDESDTKMIRINVIRRGFGPIFHGDQ
jgi:hypothetical protein